MTKHEFVQSNECEGWRSWFAGPNLGHPFDRVIERAVYADLRAAGLYLPGCAWAGVSS